MTPVTSGHGTRVAVVTGGAKGIGAAVADELTTRGFRVVTLDLLPGPDRNGGYHRRVDVSVGDEVDQAISGVVERFGRIDALVNNAGILDVHAVDDTPEAVWDNVMAVNVKSVYLTCRRVIPVMRAGGGGSIVNLSSVHAMATVPRAAVYAASKGAVLALSRQMALDCYDDHIRVNALVVGSVDTDMSTAHGAGLAAAGIVTGGNGGAIGRTAEPPEIARVVAFLVSEDAAFVTGSPVVADGGMLARLV